MTGGTALSAREGECAPASGPRGLALLGRARASASAGTGWAGWYGWVADAGERERARVGRVCCWAEQGRSEGVDPCCRFLFFFFQKCV
jgi:hypothetical protein